MSWVQLTSIHQCSLSILKHKICNLHGEQFASVDRNFLLQSALFTSSFLASDMKNVIFVPVHYDGYIAVILGRIFPYFAASFNLKL